MNFAEASRSVFKLDEAERIEPRGDRASPSPGTAIPGRAGRALHARGRASTEALSALREIRGYRAARPPHVRESDRNENRRALSGVLRGAGATGRRAARHAESAGRARPARPQQPRSGAGSRGRRRCSTARRTVLKAERTVEQAAALPWYSGSTRTASPWSSAPRAGSAAGERCAQSATRERLAGSFQIGTARSAVMPPWLAGDLVHAARPGAARAAILGRAQRGSPQRRARLLRRVRRRGGLAGRRRASGRAAADARERDLAVRPRAAAHTTCCAGSGSWPL